MDYRKLGLEEQIADSKEAVIKWSAPVDRDNRFITEFAESSPETAQIYRDWLEFDQERLTIIQNRLSELQEELAAHLQANPWSL